MRITYDTDDYAPLSFDRPEPINHIDEHEEITDPIEGRAACHLAPAEWRLLGWLEREGFAYDYYAETQLHDGTLDLDDYQVLIISTHPEYWSRAMYFAVKSWVAERGGRLMYLGGNGLNCEVEIRGRGHRDLSQRRRPRDETRPASRAGFTCGWSRRRTCWAWSSARPES